MSERSGKRKGARGRKPDAATRVVIAGAAEGVVSQASANPRPVTDPGLIDQTRVLVEAIRQTEPLARAGTPAAEQAAKAIRAGHAHRHGLRPEKALEHATRSRGLSKFTEGPHPQAQVGKAAEVVAASDLSGDVRVSPDGAARQGGDLISVSRTHAGAVFVPIGEVKTGTAKYIVRSIERMAAETGRREPIIIDSRFLNPDGSPRVAPGAFTTDAQAGRVRRAQEAGVKIRGVHDLESRAAQFLESVADLSPEDIERIRSGDFDPDAVRQFVTLRDDIARAYRFKGVAGRAAEAATMAAATTAVVTLVVQAVSEGKIDLATIGKAAGEVTVWSVGGIAADALLYHGAKKFGLPSEVAESFAGTGVTAGFCLIAVGTDVSAEVRAAQAGEISTADAVGGSAMKTALDILPLALRLLKVPAIPILIGAQFGGRWVIQRVRDGKMERKRRFVEDMQRADRLSDRMDRLQADMRRDNEELDETDRLYEDAMTDGDSK